MERVLEAYKRPHNRRFPVVCMDESPRPLNREPRTPLAGKRIVRITDRETKLDWARFLQELAGACAVAQKIVLVMDNLNTHGPGS